MQQASGRSEASLYLERGRSYAACGDEEAAVRDRRSVLALTNKPYLHAHAEQLLAARQPNASEIAASV